MPDLSDDRFPVMLRPNREEPNENHTIGSISSVSELDMVIRHFFSEPQDLALIAYQPAFRHYRILVLNHSIIGAYECTPAYVQGNGVDTVEMLIDIKNAEREAFMQQHHVPLGSIRYDHECKCMLNERKLHLDFVPAHNEIIWLSVTRHPRCGGDCIAIGKEIAPANKNIVLAATKLFGLKLAEVVLVCEDIRIPVHASGGIEEIIHNPDIGFYQLTAPHGEQDIASRILRANMLDHSCLRWLYKV